MNIIKKNIWGLLCLCSLLVFTACRDYDNEYVSPLPEPEPEEITEGQVHITQSNTVYVNDHKIVVGLDSCDTCCAMNATVLVSGNWVKKRTLDCCAIYALNMDEDADTVDTQNTVDNVTIINRDTIEIHTKALVEYYKDELMDVGDSTDLLTDKIYYLRFLAFNAVGSNNRLVNEGVINIVFDHDEDTNAYIYGIGMSAGEGSTLINRGTINITGSGSCRTRMRCMAVSGDNETCINDGTMTIDVSNAEDSRFITSGGDDGSIINNGVMNGRAAGTLFGMTHYGANDIINNGTIDLTSTPVPDGKTTVVTTAVTKVVCAFFEAITSDRADIPALTNKGTVNIHIERDSSTDDGYWGSGMMLEMTSASEKDVTIINDGTINTYCDAPVAYTLSEVGFLTAPTITTAVIKVNLNRWKTELRDFSTTHNLFVAKGVSMNFGGGELRFTKPDGYVSGTAYSVAPEDILYDAGEGGYTWAYRGYDNLSFSAYNSDDTINWDKDSKTVSFTN